MQRRKEVEVRSGKWGTDTNLPKTKSSKANILSQTILSTLNGLAKVLARTGGKVLPITGMLKMSILLVKLKVSREVDLDLHLPLLGQPV